MLITLYRFNKRIFCYFQIDDLSISSYPDERSTPEEAMNVVAKQALEELRNRSIKIDDSVTQDEHTIMKRISQVGAR
jgi:hypothetical protein